MRQFKGRSTDQSIALGIDFTLAPVTENHGTGDEAVA